MAKKAPTRRLPELTPDFPSTAVCVYENRSGEADAKLAELWKKNTRRGGLLGGDTVNSPLPEKLCSVRADLFCPESDHWPFAGPHKTAID